MLGRSDRGTLRWASGFMALVWLVNFGSCAATEGMVPSTVADITSATNELGDASIVGPILVGATYLLLGVAALGFYGTLWFTWVKNLPPLPEQEGGSEQGRLIATRMAIGAEIRVFFHLGLVLFTAGNFAPLGWPSLATQVLAAASIVTAMIVLHRASRWAGPPHADLWIVVALIVLLFAGTEAWVISRIGA